ncbi:MAG: 2'-5' RNA ligase family protein [Candidatus Izemoplasmatales bacterium]
MKKPCENPYIIKRRFNFFEENVLPKDVEIKINETKSNLNQNIWNKANLKKDVRIAILKIVKEFYEYLNLDVKIKDVIFTGSLANYNWTLSSDVDIHLILDTSKYDNIKEIIDEYLIAKKSLWNDYHNVKIKGFDVELYAKDKESVFPSKGIYTVLRDKWIQEPKKEDLEIDKISVKEKAATIMNEIDGLFQINDNEHVVIKSKKIKEKIKKLRKSGLESGGEYSVENLAFKVLRNHGYIEKLWDISRKATDELLTLNEKNETIKEHIKFLTKKDLIKESKDGIKKEFGCLMLTLPIKNWDAIYKNIKKNDLYNLPGFGLETEPHVTVLFGFLDKKQTGEEIEKVVKDFSHNKSKIKLKINSISIFENPDFDVLKFDVSSEDLTKLNKLLRDKFEYKNDYPDYKPHITIAYLKSGFGKKYTKELLKPINVSSSTFKYSYPPDETRFFKIGKKENVIGIEKDIDGMNKEKIDIIKSFINFVCNRLEIENPVSVYLHKERNDYIYTTASYAPDENSNHIRCGGRALVDILRSIAHELTHNRQRELKSYDVGESVQTIGGWIEDEANAKAGILIKDFAMNHGFDHIYDFF